MRPALTAVSLEIERGTVLAQTRLHVDRALDRPVRLDHVGVHGTGAARVIPPLAAWSTRLASSKVPRRACGGPLLGHAR